MLVCEDCGKSFSRSNDLQIHQRLSCIGKRIKLDAPQISKEFKCEACDDNYRGRYNNNYNNNNDSTNYRGYRDYNRNWDFNNPHYRPNKYQNYNNKPYDNDIELYHNKACYSKNTEPHVQHSLESPIETEVISDKETFTDMEETTYDFVVVSDSEDNIVQSSVESISLCSKQNKNDIDSVKLDFCGIKAFDKENQILQQSKQQSRELDTCKHNEEIVVDSTENIVTGKNTSLCVSSSQDLCISNKHAEEDHQPDSTTNEKVQLTTPHLEVSVLMSSDAIKALDKELENMKTYPHNKKDHVEVAVVCVDSEIANTLKNMDAKRKGKPFRSKSCLKLARVEKLKKKRSKSLSDSVSTDIQNSKSKFRNTTTLNSRYNKKSTTQQPKRRSNVKKHHGKSNNDFTIYNKPHLIDLPDDPTKIYATLSSNDPRSNYKNKVISNPNTISNKRRKTEDHQNYHSKIYALKVGKEETRKTLSLSDMKRIGKRRRKTEPLFSTNKNSKIHFAKETSERVMIDHIKPFSIKTPVKHTAKLVRQYLIHPKKYYQRAIILEPVNVESEPKIIKTTPDIEELTTKFAEYLTLFCLTTKSIKLMSTLNGEDHTLLNYLEGVKVTFRNSCKLIPYSNIDIKELITKVYKKIILASIGCSHLDIISALKITFGDVAYGLGKEIIRLVKDNSKSIFIKHEMIDDDCVIIDVKNEVEARSTTSTSPNITQLQNQTEKSNHQMNMPIPVHTNTTNNRNPDRVSNLNNVLTSNPKLVQMLTSNNEYSSYSGLQQLQTAHFEYANQPINNNQQTVNGTINQHIALNRTVPQQQPLQQQVYQQVPYHSSECQPQRINEMVYQPHTPRNVYNQQLAASSQNQSVTQTNPFRMSGGIAVRKDLLASNSNQPHHSNSTALQISNKTGQMQWSAPSMDNLNNSLITTPLLLCNTCNMMAFYECCCKTKVYCSFYCQKKDWITHCYEHNYRRV
ncbi:uncharacterized protein [Onthophagus taurus]|uniref:uncharacterized protein isoform X3 n=1 Tax=Onthophagus taurus TaxID=166361 RepID=UPI0039BDF1E0